MKKIIFLSTLLLLATNVSAHEIKSDGDMSVLLHMEPQDSPVVNESATLFFSFTEANNKFKIEDCNCSVKIFSNDQEINSTQLTQQPDGYGDNVLSMNMIFPAKNIYIVQLSGSSKTNSFAHFAINYGVRVERENVSQAPVDPKVTDEQLAAIERKNNLIWLGLGIVGICAILITVNNLRRNKK